MNEKFILLILTFGLDFLLEIWKKVLERWSRSYQNLGHQVQT